MNLPHIIAKMFHLRIIFDSLKFSGGFKAVFGTAFCRLFQVASRWKWACSESLRSLVPKENGIL